MTAFGVQLDKRTVATIWISVGMVIMLACWWAAKWVDFVDSQARAVPPLQVKVDEHNAWSAKEQPALKAATEKVGTELKAAMLEQKSDIENRFDQNEKFNNRLWDIQIQTNSEIKAAVIRMEASQGVKLDRLLELVSKVGDKHARRERNEQGWEGDPRLRSERTDVGAGSLDQGPCCWAFPWGCLRLQPADRGAKREQDGRTLSDSVPEWGTCQEF